MMRSAVFMDRDGVVNRPLVRARKPHPPRCFAELSVLPEVPAALGALKAAGYRLVIVTNQPDVARGRTSGELVAGMNDWLKSVLPLDGVFVCLHDDRDGCSCRKPLPGLITRAARELQVDCAASFMVGDRWRDIEAGRRAGCQTFFLDRDYDEPPPSGYDYRVRSLAEAAQIILAGGQP